MSNGCGGWGLAFCSALRLSGIAICDTCLSQGPSLQRIRLATRRGPSVGSWRRGHKTVPAKWAGPLGTNCGLSQVVAQSNASRNPLANLIDILGRTRRVQPEGHAKKEDGPRTYLLSHDTCAILLRSFMALLLMPSGTFLGQTVLSYSRTKRQSLTFFTGRAGGLVTELAARSLRDNGVAAFHGTALNTCLRPSQFTLGINGPSC